MREILDTRADMNAKDGKGGTALFYAAKNNHPLALELLLLRVADRSIQNGDGITAE